MDIQQILHRTVQLFSPIPAVEAIVLGGSRATGTALPTSDLDIGIYYNRALLDYTALNLAAAQLDDQHRPDLIWEEGGWGNWMNFGGWLKVDGCATDLIFRDMDRVRKELKQTADGICQPHYQTGHPHAYLNVMYRGELACCQVLYRRHPEFDRLKAEAEEYPEPMRRSLLEFFLFEAGFSASFVEKYAGSGDISYCYGHLYRSVAALNQALFAWGRTYCLNEKKAVQRIEQLGLWPDYQNRVRGLFETEASDPHKAACLLLDLVAEVQQHCQN